MNWKFVAVILISFIILLVCYFFLIPTPTPSKKPRGEKYQEKKLISGKLKILDPIPDEETFKNIVKDIKLQNPDYQDHIAYYFPNECPSYKLEYFIIDSKKYYVPEEGYLIFVKKDHKWTKEPNFPYFMI